MRVLATMSVDDPAEPDRRDLSARMAALADLLDGFGTPHDRTQVSASSTRDATLEIGTAHLGQSKATLLELAVANLESLIVMMRNRFQDDGWGVLVSKRPL